ncbi:plasmid pRiA4b ORF-3 family protein [Paracoccus sp. PAR01]|uniref:plasmid pRiA4b ORF-3 family protein n=1 Tax=Paracoccus sp. PAR01 TaxID=2769282 RepID=UPI002103A041|nr:plasmid pRiA4b ORF-3 family protein [Paracoccus sp. PAR01]
MLEDTGTRTIHYSFDFGDDWDHSIRIEKVNEAVPGVTYPRLLKASGACLPEDVGGAPGYEEFLVALADPDHEQHEDMVRWSGGSFDHEDARSDSIVERFDRLAKRWAPRPAKPKAPPEHRSRGLRRMVTAISPYLSNQHPHSPPLRAKVCPYPSGQDN